MSLRLRKLCSHLTPNHTYVAAPHIRQKAQNSRSTHRSFDYIRTSLMRQTSRCSGDEAEARLKAVASGEEVTTPTKPHRRPVN